MIWMSSNYIKSNRYKINGRHQYAGNVNSKWGKKRLSGSYGYNA